MPFEFASPESVGIPSSSITAFIDRLKTEKRNVHGFMLYRHGKLISKCIAQPYRFEDKRHVYSISKTFTGTAIGFARDEGLLTLGDRLIDIFSGSAAENISPNLARMTVHDLLSMTCGHSDGAEEDMMRASDGDWVRAFLAREVPHIPGTYFAYNSGGSYMLSAIITKLTGLSMFDYLKPRLFEPLGISGVTWDTCPKGINVGGWGMHASLEDILKIGVLYLNGGVWEGKQIISRDWVKLASSYKINEYGYHIWRKEHNCFGAEGAFGQIVIISPDKDMVLALISEDNSFNFLYNAYWYTIYAAAKNNMNTYRMESRFRDVMTADDVLPENLNDLAILRRKEESFAAMELLCGSYGSYHGRIIPKDQRAKSVQIAINGDISEFTVSFRDGIVETVRAGNGSWVRNHFERFPKDQIEYLAVDAISPVSLGACFKIEGDKIYLNVQCTDSPHGFRYTIDLGECVIQKTRECPGSLTEKIEFQLEK
ncbi:MAG: serine hydrolase [Ruminococcaceae bacterium]|nr:serine hydrolase [Oscillospiraceae bacterium]